MSEKELFDAIQEFLKTYKPVEKENKPKWYDEFVKVAGVEDFDVEEDTVMFDLDDNTSVEITNNGNGTYIFEKSVSRKEPYYASSTFFANGISKEDIFKVL